MRTWLRRWGWPIGKSVLALAILVSVGRRFYDDLNRPELTDLTFRPGWLLLCGILYLMALGFSAGFWYRLLRLFGQRPSVGTSLRAYYLGHLGKYLPGKAWALLLRGSLVAGTEVRLGVAVITAFYEVLTTMAAGALLSAILFLWQPPTGSTGLRWHPVLTGILLLGLCGIPLLPGVFNFLVGRLAARFQAVESFQLPRLRIGTLLEGLAWTSGNWVLFGVSLWAMLQAVLPDPPALTAESWARYTAILGLGYVAGFLVIVAPGGIGVREFFLLELLQSEGPRALIAAAVVLLRLVWTAAELVLAGFFYLVPVSQHQTPLPTTAEPSQ